MPHNPDPLRHIPEDELHAYLDQALSRPQCVEIEHHLSACLRCRAERDAIAALRDRTTALLVAATPRRIRPRPFTHLSATHVQRISRRAQRVRATAWAASVIGAVGLGWGLSQWSAAGTRTPATSLTPVATLLLPPIEAAAPIDHDRSGKAPAPAPPVAYLASASAQGPTPHSAARREDAPDSSATPAPVLPPKPAGSELASLGSGTAAEGPILVGVWRTVPWSNGAAARQGWLPRVEGVPVVQVKMQQAPEGGRPLTLVTQQLANGEMISTVEGPAPEVAALLSQQPGQSASAELQDMQANSSPSSTTPDGQPETIGVTAPRTLAIFGSAPSDSLKAFMLRVR